MIWKRKKKNTIVDTMDDYRLWLEEQHGERMRVLDTVCVDLTNISRKAVERVFTSGAHEHSFVLKFRFPHTHDFEILGQKYRADAVVIVVSVSAKLHISVVEYIKFGEERWIPTMTHLEYGVGGDKDIFWSRLKQTMAEMEETDYERDAKRR